MKNPASALTPDDLRRLIREALRETLYLAFDQLDSGDEVSLKDFAALLAGAAAQEKPQAAGSRPVREAAVGSAYRAATSGAPTVADLTAAELEALIAETLREALPALLNDPDWGLELREDLAPPSDQDAGNGASLSLEDVKLKLNARE